jgi:hypothetical protein
MALDAHEIRLELCLLGYSLSGRASDHHGATREFVGWVGLVAAVDALVRGGAPAEPLEVETDEAPPYPP